MRQGSYLSTYLRSVAIRESNVQAGSAALKAELNKLRKYADIIAGVDFIPFCIRNLGSLGRSALELVSEIGRRLTSTTHEPRCTTFHLCGCDAWKRPIRSGGHSSHPIVVIFSNNDCTINIIIIKVSVVICFKDSLWLFYSERHWNVCSLMHYKCKK